MTIARKMVGPRLVAAVLKPRVGTFAAAPGPEHDTEQYLTELRINARHVELIAQGMDWIAARRQARQEIEGGA
jgi:hypothetical protein